MLKITILNDNTAGRRLLAEHGLSFLLELNDLRVLLDTGASDVFLQNASRLGIDLTDLDMLVLSHGHWDHGNGLKYLKNQHLLAHPEVFKKRYHQALLKNYVGLEMSQEEVEANYHLILSSVPTLIGEDILFLGEIPRTNSFESKSTAFVDEKGDADFVPDDSGLAIRTEKGIVVISGCAHAGICNTVDYACQVWDDDRVLAVMGGFHLKKNDSTTQQTIEYLQSKNIKYVAPSHCTDLPALAQFYNTFGMKRIVTGDVITF